MLRFFFYLLALIFGITLLKSVIGVIARAVLGSGSGSSSTPQRRPEQAPMGGVLRKDPVCGLYISEATSVKLQRDGQTYHFCSEKCRDAFHA